MPLGTPISGTLGSFNVGLSAAVGFLVPLGIQLDALIALGLGPFQLDLSARLNAALSAQAGLAISIGNPLASLQILLAAVASLQAALQGALAFNLGLNVSISAQFSLMAALSGSLAIQLGGLSLAIRLALQIKIPALRAAAELAASLNAGPAFAFTYNGALGTVGSELGALYAAGLVDGSNVINPTDDVYGVTLLSSVPSVQAALQAIIQVGP
jgi:hypothetical protein